MAAPRDSIFCEEGTRLSTLNPALRASLGAGLRLIFAWGALRLGQGTIALLVRKRGITPTLTTILIAVSVIATVLIVQAPLTEAAAGYNVREAASAQYDEILVRSSLITVMTIVLNIYGTIALVGGAIYSAFIFWRKRVLANRMYGNILIAAGALMPALGGTFLKAGLPDWLYASELLGAVLMYLGFLKATAPDKAPEKPPIMASPEV